ncbi:M23 family metallopeptidase [Treponema sp.]|uniref:M23 family metallopeptidase n=1 Tax=Treponema sp. TaxID=166 RepID=UPI00298E431E|nr:M23 family metallopeptidase [Treponema sp.]
MPKDVERIMAARAACSYGMPPDLKQRINDNKRTDIWGIYSIKSGIVVLVQSEKNGNQSRNYGNSIIIQNTDETFVRYAHLESVNIQEGYWVFEGQCIGKMEDTGNGIPTPNKHLHISVYTSWAYKDKNGFRSVNAIINPEIYIKSGTYPCNTMISSWYNQEFIRKDGTKYTHEGTDFSGLDINKIDGWQKGLKGKEIFDAQN